MYAYFYIFVLALIVVFAARRIAQYHRKERVVGFKILAIAFFCIFYPISGISHFLSVENYYRGFYDLANTFEVHAVEIGVLSLLMVVLAFAALLLGLGRPEALGWPAASAVAVPQTTVGRAIPRDYAYALVLMVLGVAATWLISRQIDLAAIERGRRLEEGSAKLAFISTWWGWGVTLFYLFFFQNKRAVSRAFAFLGLMLCASLIVANLFWTGGRSVALLLVLPMVMVQLRRTRGWRFGLAFLVCYGGLLLAYVLYLSLLRAEGYAVSQISLLGFFDWEFGRYSMVGYAVDYARREGFVYGESLVAGLLSILNGPFHLFGVDLVSGFNYQNITSIVGADLFGDAEVVYVVPGILAEAYMNFGVFGVGLAFYGVGRWMRFIDKRFSFFLRRNLYGAIFFAFLGSLVCLNLLNSTVFGFLNYLFFNGFPLLLAYFMFVKRYVFRRSLSLA